VRPRRDQYRHRAVLAMVDGVAITEQGEVIDDIATYAATAPPSVWVTGDPVTLLHGLLERYGNVRAFNYQLIESLDEDGGVTHSGARLTRFGFKCRCTKEERAEKGCTCGNPPRRKQGMHLCWSPSDMARNPDDYIGDYTHAGLLKFGTDVRDWCKEQNIPLPTNLTGIAAALLKDERFWPDARGRVPRATNENVRKYLPGVHSQLFAATGRRHRAMALDQQRAYHHAAQEVPTPDPTTLFARGNYIDPDNSPVWSVPGDTVFERTITQPGVVVVEYSARPPRKHEFHPPWCRPGRNRAAIFTNEVPYAQSVGIIIEGIVAAWTSSDADAGLPKYGAWAAERISEADEYRRKWLKPTLHAAYGLLAMRTRKVTVGHLRGNGEQGKFILGHGHEFIVHKRELPRLPSATTNVPMLGVLQAEIRTRSLKMASHLSTEGCDILHIHADGIHVATDELPLLPKGWTVKERTNLEYIDRVSWVSDQGDTLPGRDEQMRIELRRHRAKLLAAQLAGTTDGPSRQRGTGR
jgi:hypothetical protein